MPAAGHRVLWRDVGLLSDERGDPAYFMARSQGLEAFFDLQAAEDLLDLFFGGLLVKRYLFLF